MKTSATKIFNQSDQFAQGWYWAMPSKLLKSRPKAVTLLGRDLVLYRQQTGEPVALDAYCPHMGAPLAQGKIQAGNIQCPLHHWQFDEQGQCVSRQCVSRRCDSKDVEKRGQADFSKAAVKHWVTTERYGLIWVWIGDQPSEQDVFPHIPELADQNCEASLSYAFHRRCHPNVVLINAIDAHHFNSVHDLPLDIQFETSALSDCAITFCNTTRGGEASRFVRLIRPLYPEAVTYRLCYWYGSTGTVTVGPDFLNFYLMFALRPTEDGGTEGWVIVLTPERSGAMGWLLNRVLLAVSKAVANYFAKGDRAVFDSIKFDFKTPLQADQSILDFIKHIEQQPALNWKTWSPVK